MIAAIDQGTTSTRCIIFDDDGAIVSRAQREHQQIRPRPGWVEHDPAEIWQNAQHVMHQAVAQAIASGASTRDFRGVGITNQRETIVFWNPTTGNPITNAIVWQDTRSSDICRELIAEVGADGLRESTGLPIATYFSGPKIRWALENVPELAKAAARGEAVAGTIESWLIWNLTGGTSGGRFVTDVTNASRTQLMNLRTLRWDDDLLTLMRIPNAESFLPQIVSSIDPGGWGKVKLDEAGTIAAPICGSLGDQQAALLGQCCLAPGEAKNTYGTGCFLLQHTGTEPIHSRSGLITTVACRIGDESATYALEGSIAIAGSLVQWLRDNLGFFADAPEIEPLAASVDDSGGVYIVPAFAGLFAPRWRSDARGVIVGLTGYATKAHLARAALEATCYQTREVLEAMQIDSGVTLPRLKCDGGMVVNDLMMQFQADILGVPVERPAVIETTALGAAYAAGLAAGVYTDLEDLRANWKVDRVWEPKMDEAQRESFYAAWLKAVERCLDWVE